MLCGYPLLSELCATGKPRSVGTSLINQYVFDWLLDLEKVEAQLAH